MKTDLAKKTIKILTVTILSVFVLILLNIGIVKAATQTWTEETDSGTVTVVEEITNIDRSKETSGWGSGRNVTKTETKRYYNYGDEFDQYEFGSTVEESYYDDNGDIKTRSGSQRENDSGVMEDYWGDADGGNFEGSTYENTSDTNDTSGGKFTYTLLQSLPKEGDDLSENVTLEQYLTWAFRFVLALAGFLAVMMIVIGGVQYIISGASESMRGEAKKRIENAIWGLVMALVSYLVLYTINPSLVDFKNNQFFKEKEKTTSESNSESSSNNTENDNSSSNVGDNLRGEGITEIEDVPFDFGDQ